MEYYVYMVKCSDETLYTGITTDVKKRVITHNTKKTAAAYTKARRPVLLVYVETCAGKGEALKREYAIKQLTKKEKIALIDKNLTIVN